eukprot:921552-Pyramimonas_sp.AAC.1
MRGRRRSRLRSAGLIGPRVVVAVIVDGLRTGRSGGVSRIAPSSMFASGLVADGVSRRHLIVEGGPSRELSFFPRSIRLSAHLVGDLPRLGCSAAEVAAGG